jgi:hypothetical protein
MLEKKNMVAFIATVVLLAGGHKAAGQEPASALPIAPVAVPFAGSMAATGGGTFQTAGGVGPLGTHGWSGDYGGSCRIHNTTRFGDGLVDQYFLVLMNNQVLGQGSLPRFPIVEVPAAFAGQTVLPLLPPGGNLNVILPGSCITVGCTIEWQKYIGNPVTGLVPSGSMGNRWMQFSDGTCSLKAGSCPNCALR